MLITSHIAPASLNHAIDAASPPQRSSQIEQRQLKGAKKCLLEAGVYIGIAHQ